MSVDIRGILAGVLAGAFWGFSFLIPKLFEGVAPSQIASGRFAWFGIFSLGALLMRKGFRKDAPFFKFAKTALFLSLSGYSLYYLLLVAAIQFVGIPVSSLIVGLLPVSIALMSGDTVHRRKQFFLALGLITLGILLLNQDAFTSEHSGANVHFGLGVLLSFSCTSLWTYFAVVNSRFLKRNTKIDSLEWASVLGVYSIATMLCFDFGIRMFVWDPANTVRLPWTDFKFLALTALLGVFSTFFASRLWNFASRVLPTGLVAQLIVSETLFALFYGFIYEKRLPTLSEGLASSLVVGGVLLAIRAYQIRKN